MGDEGRAPRFADTFEFSRLAPILSWDPML
jgi:hypothetical protein